MKVSVHVCRHANVRRSKSTRYVSTVAGEALVLSRLKHAYYSVVQIEASEQIQ